MKKILLLIGLMISPLLYASNEYIEIVEEHIRTRSNGIYHNNYVRIDLDINSFKNDEITKARKNYEREYMILHSMINNKACNFTNEQLNKMYQACDVLDKTIFKNTKVLNKQCINDFDRLGFPVCLLSLRQEGEMYIEYYNKSLRLKIQNINQLVENSNTSDKKVYSSILINDEINHQDQVFPLFVANLKYRQIVVEYNLASLAMKNSLPADFLEDYLKNYK